MSKPALALGSRRTNCSRIESPGTGTVSPLGLPDIKDVGYPAVVPIELSHVELVPPGVRVAPGDHYMPMRAYRRSFAMNRNVPSIFFRGEDQFWPSAANLTVTICGFLDVQQLHS